MAVDRREDERSLTTISQSPARAEEASFTAKRVPRMRRLRRARARALELFWPDPHVEPARAPGERQMEKQPDWKAFAALLCSAHVRTAQMPRAVCSSPLCDLRCASRLTRVGIPVVWQRVFW